MTPLAHELARRLIEAPKQKDFWSDCEPVLQHTLTYAHFFEVSAALPLLAEIREAMMGKEPEEADAFLARLAFMPASMVWMEWKLTPKERVALVLLEDAETRTAKVRLFTSTTASEMGTISLLDTSYERHGGKLYVPDALAEALGQDGTAVQDWALKLSHLTLALINSPHILAHQPRPAHAGLKRKLDRALGAGTIAMTGWTEVKLEITNPRPASVGDLYKEKLTGQRALHFCRKYIRIRRGRLEYVSGHLRGNADRGIKQSYYTVKP